MTVGLRIATRLDFATLDELEAGFCDRLNDSALFLSRALLGKTPDELYVGAPIHVDIETGKGERALSVEGVVAWAYPAHPHTPPGREPGAGIVIDRFADDDSKARAARMLKRPGAGGRVRAPGTRLQTKIAAPRPVSGKFAIPPALAKSATTTPPAPAPTIATPAPAPSPPAPPLEPPPLPSTLLAPPDEGVTTAPTHAAVHIDEATGELVVPMPPAPQPRVMAMGMWVDQSFDPTPTPKPIPIEPEDGAETVLPEPAVQRLPALPFAGLLAQLEPPEGTLDGDDDEPPAPPPPVAELGHTGADDAATLPPLAHDEPTIDGPRPISLEALPDAAPAPHAFEQRQTDVDLLVSLEDADFFPAELEEQRARARAATNVRRAPAVEARPTPAADPLREDTLPFAPSPSMPSAMGAPPAAPVVNPALIEETVTSWSQLDDLPSADGEAELVSDDDVEQIDDNSGTQPIPTLAVLDRAMAERALERVEHAGDSADLPGPPNADVTVAALSDEVTGDHDTRDGNSIPSLDSADLRTAEHSAIVLPESSLPSHEETHELDIRTQRGAAVRSTSEAALEQPTSEAGPPIADGDADADASEPGDVPPIRPLPELPPFLPAEEPEPGPMGVAFLFSGRRGPDFIHAVEPFAWPRVGTKRWNALDAAREEGNEAAMDAAVSSSPWLSRDPSAAAAFEAPGLTDPGVRVADVVTKAVALAAEEDDGSVFSDSPSPAVRPAMRPGSDDEPDADPDAAGNGSGDADVTGDGGLEGDEGEPDGATNAETTSDDAFAPLDPNAPAAPIPDPEDVETDRDMKRPPSKASADAQARLGVLQRFLGRR